MALTYLNRNIRVIWTTSPVDPFDGLKPFTITLSALLRSGTGGDPATKLGSVDMYDDSQPDQSIDFGNVGIEENGQGTVWVGAGPLTVEGEDGNDYIVSCSSFNNIMLAEEEEIVIEVT